MGFDITLKQTKPINLLKDICKVVNHCKYSNIKPMNISTSCHIELKGYKGNSQWSSVVQQWITSCHTT